MTEKTRNPLLEKVKGKIRDWNAWLGLWNRAETKEELLGLLNAGFQIYPGAYTENVCFYLEIADGHQHESNFTLFDERLSNQQGAKMRLEVARKAFEMLCQHFFTDASKSPRWPSWASLVLTPGVFEKLLWFFEPYGHGLDSGNNLPPNHEDEVVKTFLRDFLVIAWPIGRQPQEHPGETVQMLLNARPRLLEIMEEMGSLDLLIRKSRHDDLVEVDDASMKKLEELALVKYRRCERVEKYSSLDAAVLDGSQAAHVLVLLRIMQKEEKRREEIREAELQLQETKQKLARLGSPVS